MLIFQAELSHEIGLEGIPVRVVWFTRPLASEDLICKVSHSVRLKVGEGPVDAGLIIQELVPTDYKVDVTQVEECSTFLSVSIKIGGGCWSNS